MPERTGLTGPFLRDYTNAMETTDVARTGNDNDPREISETEFDRIRLILQTLTGIHLSCYKDACVRRRLAARVRASGSRTGGEYAEMLLWDKAEPARLIKTLTIHVSRFFRNPDVFAKIRRQALPELFAIRAAQGRERLVIASVGCARGEEPYTIALILRDAFAEELSGTTVSILATDIDSESLRDAEKGVYAPESLEDTPKALRKRFFRQRDGRYHIIPEIREMVEFRQGDLAGAACPPGCDLIICRNVLIYFERRRQEAILRGFAESLRSGGFLALGKTETLPRGVRDLFHAEHPVERIYRRL